MMLRILTAAVALSPFTLQAATYTLEPDYTQAVFRWSHLGFVSPAAQLSQGTGTLEFDPSNPTKSSVTVTFSLATLHSGVAALDEHLSSEDFFASAKFPQATFKSSRVEAGKSPGELKVTGMLDLHGVTKPVTLMTKVMKIGSNARTEIPTVGFSATAKLKRSDFGLGAFVPQVSDEIEVQLGTQAAEATAYAKYLEKAAQEAAAEAKR